MVTCPFAVRGWVCLGLWRGGMVGERVFSVSERTITLPPPPQDRPHSHQNTDNGCRIKGSLFGLFGTNDWAPSGMTLCPFALEPFCSMPPPPPGPPCSLDLTYELKGKGTSPGKFQTLLQRPIALFVESLSGPLGSGRRKTSAELPTHTPNTAAPG